MTIEIIIIIKVLIFVFPNLMFGSKVDKIINIIRIPPVKSIVKIIGIQISPPIRLISTIVLKMKIKIIVITFTGLDLYAPLKTAVKIWNIRIVDSIFSLIFLSLIKNSSFGYWRFRKNCFLYLFSFLLFLD